MGRRQSPRKEYRRKPALSRASLPRSLRLLDRGGFPPKCIYWLLSRSWVPQAGPGRRLARFEEKDDGAVIPVQFPAALGVRAFRARAGSGQQGLQRRLPPYNVEQLSENELRITLAVAGFSMADLTITIEENQLVIRGKQADDADRVYLHRGIAARQFQRSFVLAEGIEVRGAWLDNGLLHVDLIRPVIEPRVRTIPIRGGETDEPKSAPTSIRPRPAGNSNTG